MDALAGAYPFSHQASEAKAEQLLPQPVLRFRQLQSIRGASAIVVSEGPDIVADCHADLASMQQQQQAARQNSLGQQRPVT